MSFLTRRRPQDPPESDPPNQEPNPPNPARTHIPLNPHEPPKSMGDEGYLSYSRSDRQRRGMSVQPEIPQVQVEDVGEERERERDGDGARNGARVGTAATVGAGAGAIAGAGAGRTNARSSWAGTDVTDTAGQASVRTQGTSDSQDRLVQDAAGPGMASRSSISTHRSGSSYFTTSSSASATTTGTDHYLAGVGFHDAPPIGLLAAIGTPREKKLPFRTKKCFAFCVGVMPIMTVITAILSIYVILRPIALHALNTSVLHITASNITAPTNTSFSLTLEGQAKKTSIFPAHVFFHEPVQVYWINSYQNYSEVHLGTFPLDYLGVAAGHGRLKQETFFQIQDEAGFTDFSKFLITQDSFTWRLKSPHVTAKAFSFLATHGNIDFTKDLTLPGIGNFKDVEILDFQLPGNDPEGGLTVWTLTRLRNPSAFGVQVGILGLDLFYEDHYIGPVQTAKPLNLTPGINDIALTGRILPAIGNTTALNILGKLFTQYLNGDVTNVIAKGTSITLEDGQYPTHWLTEGIRALTLTVPLKSPQPIHPINSIQIQSLSLDYTPETGWAPMASSPQIVAGIGLPFGFSLNITDVANQFTLYDNGTAIASLSSPFGTSVTKLQTQNAGYTTGSSDIVLPPAPLILPDEPDSHLVFSQFQYDLTTGNGSAVVVDGAATAVTDTPIGQVTLDGIKFTLPAGLVGVQGLKTQPTVINSVDVTGGTNEYIELAIAVSIFNPSNLALNVGDVTFQLFSGKDFLGQAILPDLHLAIGPNDLQTTGHFQANNNPTALQTLNDFSAGKDNTVTISGFNGSTPVESLTQAFMAIHLDSTLPGLKTKLVSSTNLTVLPTTGINDNVAHAVVLLDNPFTSALSITNIQSNITARGVFLGSVQTDLDFKPPGKAATYSPNLDLTLNLFPPELFSLVRELVLEAGLSPEQLDGIVQLGGYQYVPTSGRPAGSKRAVKRELPTLSDREVWMGDRDREEEMVRVYGRDDLGDMLLEPVKRFHPSDKRDLTGGNLNQLIKRDNIFTGFELPPYILTAFKQLTVEVHLTSGVDLGDYHTTLTYTQENVPVVTDSTLLLLLPILASPIVQKIVDQSILTIDTVLISNPAATSFTATLNGAITNAGPFDAIISFPAGLTVYWDGSPLGQLAMPNVSVTGDVGAQLNNLAGGFQVADVGHLTDFTSYLVTEPSFVWQITGEGLSVSALGIVVTGISISKEVVLNGINGLRDNAVVINSFDLPSNDPAGGVHLTIDTTVTSPSSVGVDLSQISFSNSFGNTVIGPASSASAFTLPPKAAFQLPLVGRLVPQSSQQGLDDVSTLFNGYLHGIPGQLVVRAVSAGPPEATWLNDGIKALAVPVILPAAVGLDVITAITINQAVLDFTGSDSWAPAFSTDDTVAQFQLPFAFPVDINQLASDIFAVDNSNRVAELQVPMNPSTTDVVARTILLTFQNVPFAAESNNHNGFSQYLTDVTDQQTKNFQLTGNANSIANTAIGDLHVDDINFTVDTALAGLQGLNAQPTTVSDLDVNHGYPDFLQINVNAHIFNPSNITIITGDVAFGLIFQDQQIGTANIAGLKLIPSANTVPSAVHYQPSGGDAKTAGQLLLENYVQAVPSTTIIQGTDDTTDVDSLKQALKSIALTTIIPPLQQNLVTQATLVFPTDIAKTKKAQTTFGLDDPFTASINLIGLYTTAVYQGITLGVIDQKKLDPPVSAAGHTTITSQVLPFEYDLDPKNIARFILAVSSATNTDLGPLPALLNWLLEQPDVSTPVTTQPDLSPPDCHNGQQFDVLGAILNSLKGLKVDLGIESNVKLDDYQTPLNFNQTGVPAITDQTALYLTGPVGAPIVEHLVAGSTLTLAQANISDVTDDGFTTDLHGALLDTGPFDALISFPDPLTVTWNGNDIATVALPNLCSGANVAIPDLVTRGQLKITDQGKFTDFTTFILHNPSFDWTLSTKTLRVRALNTIFDNVPLSKTVSFQAFNNLPGVTIFNFDLPRDDPAGGISISTDSMIPSPATLGIDLGTASFESAFQDTDVGPLEAQNLVLVPQGVTTTHLTGRITPKSGGGLDDMSVLFSNFLQGHNQTLVVTGKEVVSPAQPDSPVKWLSKAFKTLALNVILPGRVYEIINSITLKDLIVYVEDSSEDYHVPASNSETDAVFKNPFGFSLTPVQAGVDSTIKFNNADAATLILPVTKPVSAGTSTGNEAPLVLEFTNRTLDSVNNDAYNALFAQLTDKADATFILYGGANVVADTAIGNVPINGIPFNVSTTMAGINSFGSKGVIPATPKVVGSGDASDPFGETPGDGFIRLTLTVELDNPSQLTVHTNDVALNVDYQGHLTGYAIVKQLDLVPGTNSISSEFHYQPPDPNDAGAELLVSQFFMTSDQIPIAISGASNSTPYGSLVEAFEGIHIDTSFPGVGQPFIHDILVYFDPLQAVCEQNVEYTFRLVNPVDTTLILQGANIAAYQNGILYTDVQHQFQSFVNAEPHVITDYSEKVVTPLLQHVVGSIPLLTNQFSEGLDIVITAQIRTGENGYLLPSVQYNQSAVPYKVIPTFNGVSYGNTTDDSLSGVLEELLNSLTCVGGVLSLVEGLTQLPAILPPVLSGVLSILGPSGILGPLGDLLGGLGDTPTSSSAATTSGTDSAGIIPSLPLPTPSPSSSSSASPPPSSSSSSEGGGILPSISLRERQDYAPRDMMVDNLFPNDAANFPPPESSKSSSETLTLTPTPAPTPQKRQYDSTVVAHVEEVLRRHGWIPTENI